MAKFRYKNQKIMRMLTFIGGVIALISQILAIIFIQWFNTCFIFYYGASCNIVLAIIGFFISVMTIYMAFKPDKIIPFHWLILFILGLLLFFFAGGLIAFIILIITGYIGACEKIEDANDLMFVPFPS